MFYAVIWIISLISAYTAGILVVSSRKKPLVEEG